MHCILCVSDIYMLCTELSILLKNVYLLVCDCINITTIVIIDVVN